MGGKIVCFTVINDLRHDQRMERICSTLAASGYRVEIIGRRFPDSPPTDDKPYRQIRLRCLIRKGKAAYVEYNLRLFFFLLFKRLHILGTVDCDTLPAGWLIRNIRGIKLVFDAHEWFSEVPEVVERPTVQRVWQWVEKKLIRRADAAYSVCAPIAEHYSRISGVSFGVIMNAPAYQGETERLADDERFILYQGALNKGRGLEAIITAMHQLPLKLVLVGEGDLSAELRAMVQRLGLSQKVQFAGWVKPDKLPTYTRRAWLGLNVSENLGLSYYYSLNNKFFDYIHSGLPSLVNPFPEYMRLMKQWQVGIPVWFKPCFNLCNLLKGMNNWLPTVGKLQKC